MMEEYPSPHTHTHTHTHTHIHTHIYVNMDIVLLTVFFASIEAPASIRTLVTSLWPSRAACMRAVSPSWWKYVNEGKYYIRYDYQCHIVEYYTLIHK